MINHINILRLHSPTTSVTVADWPWAGTKHLYVPSSNSWTLEICSETSPRSSLSTNSDVLPSYDGYLLSTCSWWFSHTCTSPGLRSGLVHSTVMSEALTEGVRRQGRVTLSPSNATTGWDGPNAWGWPVEKQINIINNKHQSAGNHLCIVLLMHLWIKPHCFLLLGYKIYGISRWSHIVFQHSLWCYLCVFALKWPVCGCNRRRQKVMWCRNKTLEAPPSPGSSIICNILGIWKWKMFTQVVF